jgi:hypothetical protein
MLPDDSWGGFVQEEVFDDDARREFRVKVRLQVAGFNESHVW